MRASSACTAIIVKWEKFRPTAYPATPDERRRGIWTIGYGHTKGVKEGDTCDTAQAIVWLHEDMHAAEDTVNVGVYAALTQNQYDALVSLVFNAGLPPTLFRDLNSRQFELASTEFPKWNHQSGVVLEGLTERRAEERALFDKPV